MVVCVAGKNDIAVNVLNRLATRFDLLCLPNPEDDGEDHWQPSLSKAARALDIEIVELGALYAMADLTFLSLEYSRLIRPASFETTRLFNLHFSLLPKYRGCNTSIWPILNGETTHGVTLHRIDAGIDTGAIIDHRSFPLGAMTAFEAYMTCQRLGEDLVLDWIDQLVATNVPAIEQSGEASSYARRDLDFGRRAIDLTMDREHVMRSLRAFTFPAYQYPTLDGREVFAFRTEPAEGFERFEARDGPIFLRFEGG